MNSATVKKWFFSLWGFWLLATLVYAFTFLSLFDKGSPGDRVSSVVGFFTPIWIYSFIESLTDKKWIVAFPVFLLGMIFGDRVGQEIGRRYVWRSLYNLGALAAMTMAMDMLIWGEWRSLFQLMSVVAPGPDQR